MSVIAAVTGADFLRIFILLVLAAFYFLPTIIAWRRHVTNAASVFVINLFLGWTFIGWVVALAMSVRTAKTRTA